MCLIVFANNFHPDYRLVLGANRDEFRDRPSEQAHYWPDAPHILGGRDRQAGGTWLGVTTDGRVAAVTNYRDPQQLMTAPPSRGALVSGFLQNPPLTPAEFQGVLNSDGEQFDGFNLLYGTGDNLHYFTNRGGSSGPVPPGVHGLSNHLLDTRWPKLAVARSRLRAIMQLKRIDPEDIFTALYDPTPFADDMLPDTGIDPERERLLSPIFITDKAYGTRSTTVLLIDRYDRVTLIERTFDHDIATSDTRRYSFRIQHPHE